MTTLKGPFGVYTSAEVLKNVVIGFGGEISVETGDKRKEFVLRIGFPENSQGAENLFEDVEKTQRFIWAEQDKIRK